MCRPGRTRRSPRRRLEPCELSGADRPRPLAACSSRLALTPACSLAHLPVPRIFILAYSGSQAPSASARCDFRLLAHGPSDLSGIRRCPGPSHVRGERGSRACTASPAPRAWSARGSPKGRFSEHSLRLGAPHQPMCARPATGVLLLIRGRRRAGPPADISESTRANERVDLLEISCRRLGALRAQRTSKSFVGEQSGQLGRRAHRERPVGGRDRSSWRLSVVRHIHLAVRWPRGKST